MAFLSFSGSLVGASGSFNDDGSGGTDIELDQSRDLDGSGNPYYAATDSILIEIDDADIGPDGELSPDGDGEINVLSVKINGVEQLLSPDKIKFDSSGGITEMGDGYFFIEGLKLVVLSQDVGSTFEDATINSGKLVLNVPEQTADYDLDDSGQIDSGTAEIGDGVFNIYTSNVVCFVKGTLILTAAGESPVETLKAGDLVETLDHGLRPVRMIVHRRLVFPRDDAALKPVVFKPGSLGGGLPRRTLCVSPQHRVLIFTADGDPGKLVTAKGLTHLPGIRQKRGCRAVEYYHLIFDTHEVIFSEGAATESFYPGPVAVCTVNGSARRELLALFPQLRAKGGAICAARKLVPPGQARRLYRRDQDVRSIGYSAADATLGLSGSCVHR